MPRFAAGSAAGSAVGVAMMVAAGAGFSEPAPNGAPNPAPAALRDPVPAFETVLGQALFEKLWVAAPSSTRGSDGLGPLYNARACSNCHLGGGGAALPATDAPDWQGVAGFGLVAKFVGADGAAKAHPRFGWQVQDRAVLAAQRDGEAGAAFGPEGALWLRYSQTPSGVSSGRPLRAVAHNFVPALASPVFVEPAPILSLRIAPPLAGMGLIAALPEAEILARADPEDADGDGISGRAGWAYSPDLGHSALARFGWRAEAVTLKDQVALAFSRDMGLSTPLYPDPAGDCLICAGMASGEDGGLRDGREVSGEALDLVVGYVASLRIQPRADIGARGADLFAQAGCGGCHVAGYSTGAAPYSDFLLHDMGPDLADQGNGGARGSAEWRTAPLWGGAERSRGYLHDGRARTALEAVLWHGGEARAARDRVAQMSAADRAALIEFLESL